MRKYDYVPYRNGNEWALIHKKNYGYNFVDFDGNLISEKWFYYADHFRNREYARIENVDGSVQYIHVDGTITEEK